MEKYGNICILFLCRDKNKVYRKEKRRIFTLILFLFIRTIIYIKGNSLNEHACDIVRTLLQTEEICRHPILSNLL